LIGRYEPGPNATPENGIYTGDSCELSQDIPDNSISCILTDPLYHAKHMHYYGWLAETAARVLKPGAWMFAYGGWITKEVLDLMYGKGLDYFMTIALVNKAGYPRWWSKKLMIGFKPVYVFSKGTPTIMKWQANIADSDSIDKRYHVYGQGIGFAVEKIDMFTEPGDIVFDPFCGGGQIAEAAIVTGRRYLTFEIDPTTAQDARSRVSKVARPLFTPQPQQLEFTPLAGTIDYSEVIGELSQPLFEID